MNDRHVDRDALSRFLADELPEEENRAVQRHVFTCPKCEELLIQLLPGPRRERSEAEPPGHREVVRRVAEETKPKVAWSRSALAAERQQAPGLWEELLSRAPEERRSLVWNDPRYQTWGLFELLAESSHEILPQEPRKAEAVARLALDAAEQLDASRYGAPAVEAAKAKAWTHLANTSRVLSDFRQAEQALQTAELHLSRSWLDPLDEAFLLESRAALRRAQSRFGEALALLDTAIAIYREVNEPHLQGRAMMIKGVVFQRGNEPDKAAACYRESLFLLDSVREPRLVVATQCNLILCLHESGRSAEAAALVEDARRLVVEVGKRSDLLRIDWVAARVAAATGREGEAERLFLAVRDAFIADDLVFDAALLSLDLAALYARQDRTADVKRAAAEILPIFRSREVYREALAALIALEQAAEREQLTLGLVEEISSYLKKVRTNPQLRFREEKAS